VKLVTEILSRNGIRETEIVSLIFSVTKDLSAANPASGLRTVGFSDVPLFCLQEADVEGALERVIRVLLTYEASGDGRALPVYLDGAEALRPDLARP